MLALRATRTLRCGFHFTPSPSRRNGCTMSTVFKAKKGSLANELGERKPRSSVSLLLIALFLIALVLRVEVPAHFPSIEWPDEIYNTLEQAQACYRFRLATRYLESARALRRGVQGQSG